MATLGQQAVGSIVKLNVNSVATNFIVVHQGLPDATLYDASCDGTWLLMQQVYEKRVFNSTLSNNYANLEINSYLNGDFFNMFDGDIRNLIKQAKIPYIKGEIPDSGVLCYGAEGLSVKVFLLSSAEVNDDVYGDGVKLAYFDLSDSSLATIRIAYLNDGTANSWRLRSPHRVNNSYLGRMKVITADGTLGFGTVTNTNGGVRPALILPSELNVTADGAVTVSSGAIIGTVPINGVQRELTGAGYINIGGVLRDLSDSQSNIGGTLRSMKG